MKIADRLRQLLTRGISGNQTELVNILSREGISTTQSTVSRALKKINAVKGTDETGQTVYTLPGAGQGMENTHVAAGLFGALIHDIQNNGQMIVIHTRPGTAPTVAKVIDDHGFQSIIGTVAGDDTILIVPANAARTRQTANEMRTYLARVGLV